jgi:hypothetical protein
LKIVVDVAESPVGHPKHRQKRRYSGKKNRHTVKTQIVICRKTKQVVAVFVDCGRTRDSKMWNKSIGVKVVKNIKTQGDSGNQGIGKLHKKGTKSRREATLR